MHERLRVLADAISQELRRALHVADGEQDLARAVLDTKSPVRALERAAVEFQLDAQPANGRQTVMSTMLERELTESLRRAYGLVRRFVRVGAGLLRTETN
ncbi:hypothetical protein ACKVEX_12900 [Rhodocyclaceae bacterium SMB388]